MIEKLPLFIIMNGGWWKIILMNSSDSGVLLYFILVIFLKEDLYFSDFDLGGISGNFDPLEG